MEQHISTLDKLAVCSETCPVSMRRCELREHVSGVDNLCQTIVNLAKPIANLTAGFELIK